MSRDWPLVGRRAQVERVRALISAPAAGGVVVAGAEGVGKTRLAEECLRMAERVGYATARVSGTRSACGLPFGAIAPLLPHDEGATWAHFERAEVLRRTASGIALRGEGKRLVLMVDDAHLLDEASAVLVLQLAESRSVFVLATVRCGQGAPDAIVSLWKDGAAERLDIAPLALDEVETLVSVALGGSVDGATVRDLATRSEGNPLFLHELVLAALDAGAVLEQDGVVFVSGALPLSNRLIELVESRIEGLSDEERHVLDLLAFGEGLGASMLTALTDPLTIESLERRGLVAVARDRRRLDAWIAHPIHGDVLRQRTGALRALRVKRDLADALESTGARRREDLLRLAAWRLEAGGAVNSRLMLRAAGQARARCDYNLAEQLVSAAIDVGGGVEAALLSGQLLYLQGQCHEAEQRLAPLAGRLTCDLDRGRLAAIRMDNLWYGLGLRDETVRVGREAEATISDSDIRDIVVARRAGALGAACDLRAALELIQPLLERATGPALAWACMVGAVSLVQSGRTAEAVRVADRGLAVHRALPADALLWRPSIHEWARAYALTEAGRVSEAESELRATYERALEGGSLPAEPYLAWEMSKVTRTQGRMAASVRWAGEAVSVLRRTGWPGYLLRFGLADLAHSLAVCGRATEAAELMAEIDALPASAVAGMFPESLVPARAWTLVAQGELEAARGCLREAAVDAAANGARTLEMVALHDLARLGCPGEVVVAAGDLAGHLDGTLARARADHVGALVSGDPVALDAVSRSFEELGCLLLAAEAAADAGRAQRRAGGARSAIVPERRAVALAARCPGAVTPALAAAAPRVLSPREREIAAMAGDGLASRDIAERLFLSVRTVENQLQRAYEKLGVSKRAELAEVLGPSGFTA